MARRLLLRAMMIGLAGCGLVTGCAQPAAEPVDGVSEQMLLGPEDFGEPGWRPDRTESSATWAFAMPQCAAYDDADHPAQQHRDAVRTRAFVHPPRSAVQWVERFESGWATRSVEDVRRVVVACGRYEYGEHSPGAPGFVESHRIVDSGFAGDESLLVKTERLNQPGESYTRYTAVVRSADFVVTLAITGGDADSVRRLARRAVDHIR